MSVASKDMGVQNVQQLEGSYKLLLYITLHTIVCTRTELLNDIDNTVAISCYYPMFKPYLKKKIRGKRQAHYVPNISYFKLLL